MKSFFAFTILAMLALSVIADSSSASDVSSADEQEQQQRMENLFGAIAERLDQEQEIEDFTAQAQQAQQSDASGDESEIDVGDYDTRAAFWGSPSPSPSTPTTSYRKTSYSYRPTTYRKTAVVGDAGQACKYGQTGTCGTRSSCSGTLKSGYCNGGGDNICCVPRATARIGDAGQPCKYGQTGTCGTRSSCSGTTKSGYCNGGGDNVCCVPRSSTPSYSRPPTTYRPVTSSGSCYYPGSNCKVSASDRHITAEGSAALRKYESIVMGGGRQCIVSCSSSQACRYDDGAGFPTIGYGHLCHAGDGLNCISKTEAMNLFNRDIGRYERAVANAIKVPLNDHQFNALVSFTYNLGTGVIANRSYGINRALREQRYSDVCNELMKWVKSAGRRMQGLVNRRAHECKMFKGEGY